MTTNKKLIMISLLPLIFLAVSSLISDNFKVTKESDVEADNLSTTTEAENMNSAPVFQFKRKIQSVTAEKAT